MMENVAEITAWLPTTAASVAITKTGQNTCPAHANVHGNPRNNGQLIHITTKIEIDMQNYKTRKRLKANDEAHDAKKQRLLTWNRHVKAAFNITIVARQECSLAHVCKN